MTRPDVTEKLLTGMERIKSNKILFSEWGHVINNDITTTYITLSAGTSNVMMTSLTAMQIFIEINKL